MIHIILVWQYRFPGIDIPYLIKLQNSFPTISVPWKVSSFFHPSAPVYRSALVPQDYYSAATSPSHTEPTPEYYRVVLNHFHPDRMKVNFFLQPASFTQCVGQHRNCLIDSVNIFRQTPHTSPVSFFFTFGKKACQCPIRNHMCKLFLGLFQFFVVLFDDV